MNTPTSSRPFSKAAAALAATAALIVPAFVGAIPAAADEWRDQQFWLEDYAIEEAWETSEGEGVTVAIIDSGIDTTHPDLDGVVVGGKDFSGVGNSNGTEPIGAMPEHGTMVATLLAGQGNNSTAVEKAKEARKKAIEDRRKAEEEAEENDEDPPSPSPLPKVPDEGPGSDGIKGVAPKAKILSASVFLGDGNHGGIDIEEQIPQAVRWAVDQGADIINMSLGSNRQDWPRSWDDAFLYAEENDVLIVAAAGNRATGALTVGAPATIPGVLTVAGLDEDGSASWDSSSEGISIGVAAPADPLIGGLPGGDYTQWAGTSGAAPIVAGVAALIRAEHPDMPAHQVIERILTTAEDAGTPGVDTIYGHGIIQPLEALTADVPAVDKNPMDTIAEWIRVHRRGNEPTEQVTAPEFEEEDSVALAPTPSPKVLDRSEDEGLQGGIVMGFTGALAAILIAGTVHLVLRNRGKRGV